MSKRKGQHLAVETVLSLGVGLLAATATITLFASYSDTVMNTIHERHASKIESTVLTAVYNLKDVNKGSEIQVEIPELSGGDSYQVSFDNRQLIIEIEDKQFKREINNVRWASDLEGDVSGSEIKISKLGNKVQLRSG